MKSLFFLAAAVLNCAAATYENPVLAGDYPDPAAIRVGNVYWATATSSEWAPQFPLMRSTDLVNWEVTGSVFETAPEWSAANYWAPEIVEYKGRYYIYYVGRKKGGPLSVAVASADKPQGPYQDHGILVSQAAGSIDAIPFTDEKGERYLIWKEDGNSRRLPTVIWAQRLSEDGTKLFGEMRELFRNDAAWEGAVVEGPFVVRRGEWFYIFYSGNACCGRGCHYGLGVARSKSLHGPYEKHPRNPILAENGAWRCPGHGSIVTDPSGRHWLLYHAYDAASFIHTGREALLDEVVFGDDGWPSINEGKGPSVQANAPHETVQKKAELSFVDEFDAAVLQPGWNWPVGDRMPARLKDGKLLLAGQSGHKDETLGSLLGRSITGGDFIATAALDRSSLDPGESAGLAVVGDRGNAAGIALADGKLQVWRRVRGETKTLASAAAPVGAKLHLQVRAKNGSDYAFSFGSDGQASTELLRDVSGGEFPPWDRAVRVCLTVAGPSQANPEVRFENFEVTARRSAKPGQ